MYTIFFPRSFSFSFSFLFFLHLPPHSLLPSPQKPKTVLPSSSKSISQNPKPKSRSQLEQKSKPKNHDFSTGVPWVWRSRHQRNIFCCGFVFSVLSSSSKSISQNPKPFLKIPNPNHNLNRSKNCCGFVFSQLEQKLLNHNLNRSKNYCGFVVRVFWVGPLEGTRVLETQVPRGFS